MDIRIEVSIPSLVTDASYILSSIQIATRTRASSHIPGPCPNNQGVSITGGNIRNSMLENEESRESLSSGEIF